MIETNATINNFKKVTQPNKTRRYDFYIHPSYTNQALQDIRKKEPRWIAKAHTKYEERIRPTTKETKISKFKYMKILTWNMKSFNTGKIHLKEIMEKIQLNFILLQETRIKNEILGTMYHGYNHISKKDIEGTPGARGMMILWKKHDDLIVSDLNPPYHWLQCVEAKDKSSRLNYIIMNVYLNPTKTQRKAEWPYLIEWISHMEEEYPNHRMIIGGDWNEEKQTIDEQLEFKTARRKEGLGSEPTWFGPIDRQKQLDHFVVSPNFYTTMVRASEQRYSSDHLPVTMAWAAGENKRNVNTKCPKRMVHKLVRGRATHIQTSNYFLPLMEDNDSTLEEFVDKFNEAAWKIAEEQHCVSNEANRKRIQTNLSKETKKAKKRRDALNRQLTENPSPQLQTEYSNANRSFRKLYKLDKAAAITNMQNKMVDSIILGQETDQTWKTLQGLAGTGRKKHEPTPLMDPTTGIISSDDTERAEILHEHYQRLFEDQEKNSKNPSYWYNTTRDDLNSPELEELNQPLSWAEIHEALHRAPYQKSPGKDGIVMEFYKSAIVNDSKDPVEKKKWMKYPRTRLAIVIMKLFTKIWEEEKFPNQWNLAQIVSIPKKPNSSNPNDYRGISLLNTLSKLFTSILARRISRAATKNERLALEQGGFRSLEETTAQAMVLTEVLKMRKQQQLATYATFIDAEKAFDRVPHEGLLRKLELFGIGNKMINMIREIYNTPLFEIKEHSINKTGIIRQGVKQGDPLSPILFILFMNDLPAALQQPTDSIRFSKHTPPINCLMFADDVVLLAANAAEAEQKALIASNWMGKWNMKVNPSKCGMMIINSPNEPSREWKLQGKTIPYTKSYVYLGIHINDELDMEESANFRIEKARKALAAHTNILRSSTIPIYIKIAIVKAVIIPMLTYGTAIWGWSERSRAKSQFVLRQALQRASGCSNYADHRVLSQMLNIPYTYEITIKATIRLILKSYICNTHLQDIWELPVYTTFKQKIIAILKRLDMAKFPIEDQFGNIDKKLNMEKIQTSLDYERLAEVMIWKSLDEKIPARALYAHGNTHKIRELYLQIMKTQPELSKGMEQLTKIRAFDYKTAPWYAARGYINKKYFDICPFCKRDKRETILHIIDQCPQWSTQRIESGILDYPRPQRTYFIAILTGMIKDEEIENEEFWMAAYSNQKKVETGTIRYSERDFLRNISAIAKFLQSIRLRRWKYINQLQRENEPKEPAKKQSSILDFFAKL